MAEETKTSSPSDVAPGSLEPQLIKQQSFTDVVYLNFPAGKKFSHSGSLSDILGDAIKGCATVTVDEMSIRFSCSGSGQSIKAGIGSVYEGNVSAAYLAMRRGNLVHTSNSMNTGIVHDHRFVVPGTLSLQVQPTSASKPMMQLKVEGDAGISAMILFHITVHGPRLHFLEVSGN